MNAAGRMGAVKGQLLIGAAGASGAVARMGVGGLLHSSLLATFTVNMAGTLLLCFIAQWAELSGRLSPFAVTVLTTGFLGAFTTFSAVSLETVELVEKGSFFAAAAYIAASLLGGLAMAASGFSLAKKVAA